MAASAAAGGGGGVPGGESDGWMMDTIRRIADPPTHQIHPTHTAPSAKRLRSDLLSTLTEKVRACIRVCMSVCLCTISIQSAYLHLSPIPPRPPHTQLNRCTGDDSLVGTVYSMSDLTPFGSNKAEFKAVAEFVRLDPGAPRGQMEARIASYESSDRLSPAWPCRTRAVLLSLLSKAICCAHLEYVLILSRGRAPEDRGRLDKREVADVDHLRVRLGTELHEDGAKLTFAEFLAETAFPPDDGYICFPITTLAFNGDAAGWRCGMSTTAANLVMTLVGEVPV
jgi:hypothetical protein